jgi:hypothetical protein
VATRKRLAIVLASVGAIALVGLTTLGTAQSRACGEAWDVTRGGLKYWLCGVSGEPIAKVPLTAVVSDARFAWRLADGNKPGWHSLKYETSKPDDARTALTSYLRSAGFSPRPSDTAFGLTWWATDDAHVGFALRPLADGHALVEVTHDSGLE